MSDVSSPPPAAPPPPSAFQSGEFWRRILYMIGYGLIAYFVLLALFVVALVQAICVLFSSRRSAEIEGLARNLTRYLSDVVAFVSWASDEKPFPAQPFPGQTSPHS